MSLPYLPEWVLDLVAAVDEFESTHAKAADECLIEALNAVPVDVRGYAQGFLRGKRRATESTKDGTDA